MTATIIAGPWAPSEDVRSFPEPDGVTGAPPIEIDRRRVTKVSQDASRLEWIQVEYRRWGDRKSVSLRYSVAAFVSWVGPGVPFEWCRLVDSSPAVLAGITGPDGPEVA